MMGFFSLHRRFQADSRAHSASYPGGSGGEGALSSVVKRTGRETDHSLSSSSEINNAWSYISTPSIRFHGVVFN
jgi:hypothetical protein